MVTSSNMDKYYHGNLMERSQALVFALTGNYGKKGSGFVGFPWLDHDAIEHFIRSMFGARDMLNATAARVIGGMLLNTAKWKLAGYTDEMITYEQGRAILDEGRMTSGALFWYVHGGLLETSEKLHEWDPYLKRPVKEVLEESFAKGWQSVWPRPGNDPKMLFVLGGQSAAPRAQLPAPARAPVAEARRRGDARLAHDLDGDVLRLRAAGGGLVRTRRAQVGDAADALHPLRREGDQLLRGQVGLGDHLAPHRGHRPARQGAGHRRASSTGAATSARFTTSTRSSRAAASSGTPTTRRSSPR